MTINLVRQQVIPGTSQGEVPVSGLPGLTNGTNPPSGYAGHAPASASYGTVVSTYNATESWQTVASIALTAGNWLLLATGSAFINAAPSSGALSCDFRIQDTTNNVTIVVASNIATANSTLVAGNDQDFAFNGTGYYSVSSSATLAVQIGASANTGTPTGGQVASRGGSGTFFAVQMP